MLYLNEIGQQIILFSAIIFALTFWIWGKIKYDIVALIALTVIILGGVVPFESAFRGFSNPAVIIVVAVLIMSRGIINTGFIDLILAKLPIKGKSLWIQISLLTIITAFVSAFVYNIGALAIIMPLAIGMARKKEISSAYYLIPIAFAAHMGGFLTLIGNAPNIIVSSFRADLGMGSFDVFDFGQVGLWIVLASIFFISLIGWRLMPDRKGEVKKAEISKIEDYTSEFLVSRKSFLSGKRIKDLKKRIKEEFIVCSIIRGDERIINPNNEERVLEGDSVLIKANAEVIRTIIRLTGLKLNLSKESEEEKEAIEVEVVVGSLSRIIGYTLNEVGVYKKFNVEVEAISRHEQEIDQKIKDVKLKSGDIILLKGREEDIDRFLSDLKLLPLAERYINIEPSASMAAALLIFLFSILFTVFGVLPVEISFFLGALAMIGFGILTTKQAYQSVDWSIVIVLGALIPFGGAMINSGAADLIASGFLNITDLSPLIALALVLIISIIMSDFINNVGVAVLMAPIAVLLAQGMGVSVDPFLMAVAIGGSCAFLTPVGHQVNLLVMNPGGYKFTDYWKLGLCLNVIIFIISIILLPRVWPF